MKRWVLVLSGVVVLTPGPRAGRVAATQTPRELKYVHVDVDGNLDVSYPANLDNPRATDPGLTIVVHVIRNIHTDPKPRVDLRRLDTGFEYEYVIENGRAASQPIDRWYLIVDSPAFIEGRSDPPGWFHVPPVMNTPRDPRAFNYVRPPGYFAEWLVPTGPGGKGPGALEPGEQKAFTVRSNACPGFVRGIFAFGFQEDPTGDMPGAVADELRPFLTMQGAMQHRTMLGPAFAKGTSRAQIGSGLRQSVLAMIAAKELDGDSAFVRETADVLARLARGDSVAADTSERKSEPSNEIERQLRIALQSDCMAMR